MSLGSPVQTLRHLHPCSLPYGSSLVPRILCVNRDPGNESMLYKCMWCYFTEWIVDSDVLLIHPLPGFRAVATSRPGLTM